MAPPSGAGAPTGCFKCGRPGHWSRDCPSSSSSSSGPSSADPLSSQQQHRQQSGASVGGRPSSGPSSTSWKSGKPPLKAASAAKPVLPRKRPKLTPDLLLSNEGLGYVLEHFPRMVRLQGPGHEVDDLKSFLEAYVHWHSLILPYFSFNQFVEKVAKVGASRRVRMCVNDLKDKVARGEDLKLTPEEKTQDRAVDDHDVSFEKELPMDEGNWDDQTIPTDVNDDVFDEFYKQATDQPCEAALLTMPSSASTPESTTANDHSTNSSLLASSSINEDQRVRMEANRLKALERAKARAASLVPT
ncbi:hypothetical protein GOP47_0022875 [Adiantum capillus-veneris]|uniref:CCHC-type domain-containing protein n=1 Tax=Adiantum capillus-veneris TaxID=13818 RepID=A0A9D4Z7A4_ADICA|nr:hypothetical protein GOP47_0022875 [Adiantum capillus-veneris]